MALVYRLKKLLPKILGPRQARWVQARYRHYALWRNNIYDHKRFRSFSGVLMKQQTRMQKRAQLTFDYHKIEKGLSLTEPRSGFGRSTVKGLIKQLSAYEKKYGQDDVSDAVISVLQSYVSHHEAAADGHDPELSAFLTGRTESKPPGNWRCGGTLSCEKKTFFPVAAQTASRFLQSRHSVRNFSGEFVHPNLVTQAVRLAQSAPSVCNRQSGRVYVSNEPEVMKAVLAHQSGNRGFGHNLGVVFIVAADLEAFMMVGERNQPFVDGGIFAMALLQGLHALGLGACMLNWSTQKGTDMALRREFGIPDSHVVITMIGAGHVPDRFKVAASPRIPVDDIVTWLK